MRRPRLNACKSPVSSLMSGARMMGRWFVRAAMVAAGGFAAIVESVDEARAG